MIFPAGGRQSTLALWLSAFAIVAASNVHSQTNAEDTQRALPSCLLLDALAIGSNNQAVISSAYSFHNHGRQIWQFDMRLQSVDSGRDGKGC